MTYPLVKELAAEGIPVRLTCGVLGFSTQAFYKWRAHPVSDRDWHDAHVINAIVDVHVDDPEFGYRFIADELEAAGHRVGERRVWRLCHQHKVWSTTTRKGRRGSGKTPGPAVHDDLARRQFSAQLDSAIVATGGPVGWGQSRWRTRLTCHLTYLRFTTRGLLRFRRVGLRRRQSSTRAWRQPWSPVGGGKIARR